MEEIDKALAKIIEDITDGGGLTFAQFWRKHDAEELKLNGIY